MNPIFFFLLFLLFATSSCGGGKEARLSSHVQRGEAMYDKGFVQHAQYEFAEALQENPNDEKAQLLLALTYQIAGAKEAEELYRDLLVKNDNLYAGLNLVRFLRDKNRDSDALELLSLLEKKANALDEKKKKEEKRALLGLIHFGRASVYFGRYALGLFLLDPARLPHARREVQLSLSFDETFAESHYLAGRIEEEAGNATGACDEYEKAIEAYKKKGIPKTLWPEPFNKDIFDTRLVRYLFSAAFAEEKLQRYEKSLDHLRQAMAQPVPLERIKEGYDPEKLPAYYRLGRLLYKMGRYPEASLALKDAMQIDPLDNRAEELLSEIESKHPTPPEKKK